MGKVKLPPKSNKGCIVKHREDGRYGRTYHHNPDVKGKLMIHWEETPLQKDWKEKAVLVDPKKLQLIGFID